MVNPSDLSSERVRPLLKVRQVREFSDRKVAGADLDAIADVARWTGSSMNTQPWRFLVLTSRETIKLIADASMPQTRSLVTASAAIAIVLPDVPGHEASHAFDEGRAAERILVAASALGLGAGIAWILPERRDVVREILGVPADHFVRTIVALGHPTEAAQKPKSAPGTARLPRAEVVFGGRWPTK